MLARRAWAVQMFDVAFYLLMCCYLVWRAILKANLLSASIDRPIILPGIFLTFFSRVEKKPEYGPPKPIGTPNLWAEPKQMSAPMSPGALTRVKAKRSEATTFTTLDYDLSILANSSVKSCRMPFASGVWTTIPKNSVGLYFSKNSEYFPTMTSKFKNLALVWMTAWVGVNTFSSKKIFFLSP